MRTLLSFLILCICVSLRADELPRNTREIETLTVEQAKILIERGSSLYLDSLKNLTPEVARVLAQYKYNLSLNGLTSLSNETAKELLATTSEKRNQKNLSLNGLQYITPEVASELVKVTGNLTLHNLTEVSTEVGKVLIGHKSFRHGHIRFRSISRGLAQLLAHSKTHLDLSMMQSITPEIASLLSVHDKSIDLSGLRSIDPKVAKELAKYKGMAIVLAGLQSIQPDVAKELSQWSGDKLYLNRLQGIDIPVATQLGRYRCQHLGLSGLTSISTEVARELGKFSGASLDLAGIAHLNPKMIDGLSDFRGSLKLGGLSSLNEDITKKMASINASKLMLCAFCGAEGIRSSGSSYGGEDYSFSAHFNDSRGLYTTFTKINIGVAKHLANYQGEELGFLGLTTIDKDTAKLLLGFKGEQLVFNCLDYLDDETFNLLIASPSVKQLPIKDFRRLTQEQAKALVAQEKNRYSFLGYLEIIDAPVAKELLAFKGNLNFFNLKSIDDKALEILSQRPNYEYQRVDLKRLARLTNKQLKSILAEKNSGYLSLELTELNPELARILAAYDGEFHLNNKVSLSNECFDILIEKIVEQGVYNGVIGQLSTLTPHQANLLSERLEEDDFTQLLSDLPGMDVPLATWLVNNQKEIICGPDVNLEVIEVLAGHDGRLEFRKLKDLSPKLASALSHYDGELHFIWGPSQLSHEVEMTLAKIPGSIFLDDLQEIKTTQLAEKIVNQHNTLISEAAKEGWSQELALGLMRLDVPVAKELVKADEEAGLSFYKLEKLQPDVANILIEYPGPLYLKNLTEITHLPLAEKLSQGSYYRETLYLDNLETISVEAAAALTKNSDALSLCGLTGIAPEAARKLAKCSSQLEIGLPELSPETAAAFVSFKGKFVLNLVDLTPAAAEKFINNDSSLTLNIKNLNPKSAEILARREAPLLLVGLNEFSDQLATALSKTKGDLHLELSRAKLTNYALAELAKKDGVLVLRLSTGGYRNQINDPELANSLAEGTGTVALEFGHDDFQQRFSPTRWTFSPAMARAFARKDGILILDDGFPENKDSIDPLVGSKGQLLFPKMGNYMNDPPPAFLKSPNIHINQMTFADLTRENVKTLKTVERISPEYISLSSVKTLTHEAALDLAKDRAALSLSGVTTISPQVAKALATHVADLELNALTQISADVAKQLANNKGNLSLNSLTELTPEVSIILASKKGTLELNGLTKLDSKALATKLASGDRVVSLNLTTLSPKIAEILATCDGGLYLYSVDSLPVELARAISKSAGEISLSSVLEISEEVAKELSDRTSPLDLSGLKSLTPKAAEILSRAKCPVYLSGLETLFSVPLAKKLVTQVNSASEEGVFPVQLDFYALNKMTPEVAKELSKVDGDLYLSGLKKITIEEAKFLSNCTGNLYLSGLEEILPEIARELALCKYDLDLSGLVNPKQEIIKALLEKKTGTLFLSSDVLESFPSLAENKLIEIGYGGMGGGMGGGMF